jgi:hypothetical protein
MVARIAEEKLRVLVEVEVGARKCAVLREARVGKTSAKDVGWKSQKACDCRVVIETIGGPQRADAPAVHVEQKPVFGGAVS